MKTLSKTLLTSIILASSLLVAKPFAIDKTHSAVNFEVKHLGISKVEGSFDKYDGVIEIDPKTKKITRLEGEVSISSINTKNADRDSKLKSPDFFNADKNAKGYFKMTRFKDDKIYGDLTLNGIKKQVVLEVDIDGPVTHPMNKKQVFAIEIDGEINRKDFKIGTGFANGLVSDKVKIEIHLEVNG